MTDLASVPRRSERVVTQGTEGAQVLLALDTGRYYTLNDVGATVWSRCDGLSTLASVVEAVCAEFDAPAAVVEADVIELVGELLDEGLLVEAG